MTSSPKPRKPSTPATSSIDFPYKWDDISSKLLLTSPKEILKFILTPSFLNAWTDYRDMLPLMPGVAIPIIAPKDKEAMTNLVDNIYTMMDSMCTSAYDRLSPTYRTTWDAGDYMNFLIYQSTRDLASPGNTFHSSFLRSALKNEAGRKEAFHRLRGLIMLVCNLVVNYTLMPPSNVIKGIEVAKPAWDPNFSPIPDVRIKWQLAHMGVDELRKKVLDGERGEREEKKWLISKCLHAR
jgi:hypothetical protein